MINNQVFRRAIRVTLIAALAFVSSCGRNIAVDTSVQDGGSNSVVVATPPPSQTPTPAPSPTPDAASVVFPLAEIADNFPTATHIVPASWGKPGQSGPTDPGAFRFGCGAGQLAKNDPLMLPGQPGASHLHQFFGNTLTNASSTYQSLRTTGASTCDRGSNDAVQRSAYWIPAMLDGAGNAIKPDWMNTYYKRQPLTNPACQGPPSATSIGYCVGLPNGLRFIFGYNMKDGSGGPTDANSPDQWAMGFDCVKNDGTGESFTGVRPTIAAILATGKCPVGQWLRAFATIPYCWDGKNLDSADHRSHMAYATGEVVASAGQRSCPPDHPYVIPELAAQFFFTTDANFAAGKWRLSSDEMMPGTMPGKTWHMDYWEAWSAPIKAIWEKNCINGHLSCSSGELGDGTYIKGMESPDGGWPRHVVVPLSSI